MESLENLEIEDLRQSEEYGKYMGEIGWRVIKLPITNFQFSNNFQIFIRNIGPVGIAKIQRVRLPLDWGEVDKVLRENRVVMCKLEPLQNFQFSIFNFQSILKSQNFKRDNWPLLATKTVRVDLRPSEEKIFGSFKKDARYVLRKCLMFNDQCLINKFEKFFEIWKKSARRKGLWIPNEREFWSLVESFGKKCFCLTLGDQAGVVVLVHDKTAYYYYAGATREGNEKNLPYLVVWEAMREAKRRGCKIWDFEGIYDPRWPNKGWGGFSHFKKSFGGVEIEFPGSFTLWRWPF